MYDGDNDTASSLLIFKFKTLIMATFYLLFVLSFIFLFLRKKHSDRLNSLTYYLITNILSEAKQFPYVFTLMLNCKRVYNAFREGQLDFSVRLISFIIPEKCNNNVPYYGTPICTIS